MDVTDEYSDSQIQLSQNLIGIMRWTVKLGRIDIAYEISLPFPLFFHNQGLVTWFKR